MIQPKELLQQAEQELARLQNIRRDLHAHPEVGFELNRTKQIVKDEMEALGIQTQEMGRCGLVATLGKGNPVLLLRADMDALPIQEEAECEFKSAEEGKMHGCGHDMHTAMLLGAAKLLKEHEEELEGTIKLEFQPAEEIFQGSKDMIEAGLLKNPDVDAAFMMHVVPGLPMPSGMLLMPAGGISMASCEQYHIHVQGKGGHGSMPNACIDPITAAAHIHLALQEISARELDPNGFGVFTTGKFVAGAASNIIPDFADMYGTIRTSDPNNHTGSMIKERMSQIASSVGEAYRCKVDVEFFDYCPCMQIDGDLAADGLKFMQELMPESIIDLSKMTGGKAGGGSEDFAFVSHEVPTLSVLISAGNANEGYCFSQHHPKVIFDDSILAKGSAVYAYMGMRYLQEHHKD